jgi:hypothetical protein
MLRCFLTLSFSFALLGIAGCGDTTSSTPADLAANTGNNDLASICGHPNDTGNSLGVGKYCNDPLGSECSGNSKAKICSTLGDMTAHFCTFICTLASDAGPGTDCGSGATCFCRGAQCACTPLSCLK